MDKPIAAAISHENRVPLLQANDLIRRSGKQVLLDHVSLTVQPGERIAVVGPTASGKTLLLRSLALLDPLDGGNIVWHGERISHRDISGYRSQVVYLHQRPALMEGTVEANLRFPFSLKIHSARKFDIDALHAWLATLDRDGSFLSKRQRDLSGGESQIVALLRAIQLEPEVLLLDESTSALDAETTTAIEQLIDKWFDQQPDRRATVWVTHDQQQAQRVADRVLEMRVGVLSPREST
ncbi:ABC transporter ATP-binding protein [Thalassoroseus pseudoceratinae]|uniref:ABC transporter ATP-binding protein n=1 Tax=Thalassoroseus pseudoceratinae TaxID=2713176 RepID=UPI0019809CA9|nr:ATP-binding cassette domain-containing protein [Thalassoroseus pseudoceratinae]